MKNIKNFLINEGMPKDIEFPEVYKYLKNFLGSDKEALNYYNDIFAVVLNVIDASMEGDSTQDIIYRIIDTWQNEEYEE